MRAALCTALLGQLLAVIATGGAVGAEEPPTPPPEPPPPACTTWTAQTSGVTVSLNGVDSVDVERAWAVGDDGTILTTQDGGATWAAQVSGTGGSLRGVSFIDATHGWIVGDAGTILARPTAAPRGRLNSRGSPTLFTVSRSSTPFVGGRSEANRGWAES